MGTRRAFTTWAFAAAALVLTVPATIAIARADDGLYRAEYTVSGVPLTVIAPDDEQERPAAVVVHGFAGSSAIMDPLAVALARAGYRVVVPDLRGHGSNPQPLPLDGQGRGRPDALTDDIGVALDWITEQPGVVDDQVGLVGHSMGAGAVVAYGVADAGGPGRVRATVAISLPSASGIPAGEAAVPRNLLLLWGSAEPPRFAEAGQEAVRAAYPDAEVGRDYGAADDGTARGTRVIPGVEHITVVYSQATAQEVVDWLDSSVAVGSTGTVVPADPRLLWLALLLVGMVLGFVPLARLLFGTPGAGPGAGAPVVPGGRALAAMVAAGVVASLAGLLVSGRPPVLPLSVADYAVLWFATAGAVGGLLAWWLGRRGGAPGGGAPGGGVGRQLVATLALTSYLVAALALASRATWADFALVGPRTWVLLVVELAFLAFFWADERLATRASRPRRLALVAANRAVVLVTLLASVALLGAPGVLTLWVPLLAPLLALLAACGFVVSGLTRERWAPAVVQAIPLAYVVASAFPLVAGG